MSALITAFFTRAGVPATDIPTITPGFPTIRIWEVIAADQTLVIGAPEGTGDPGGGIGTDGVMTIMFDKTAGVPGSGGPPPAGSIDGFYKFDFTGAMGFLPTNNYVVRIDGGASVPAGERYIVTRFGPDQSIDVKVDAFWDEPLTGHDIIGTFGGLFDVLRKYETNRTRIDPTNKTLTVFDDDCTTPLRVFELRDSAGALSVDEVCERDPDSSADGFPVCP